MVVTPVSTASPIPVPGTDGRLHVAYELQLVNTQSVAAPITSIEVLGVDPRSSIVTYGGADLVSRLRRLDGEAVDAAVVDARSQLLLLVDLTIASYGDLPAAFEHRVTLAPTSAGGAERAYTVANIALNGATPLAIGPPVDGKNWVVTNGCCSPTTEHRTLILPTDAGLSAAERFAIDFRQLNPSGHFLEGDPTNPASYTGDGANVLAVAPGKVVSVVSTFPEEVPGIAAPDGTFDPDTREGNSVVIDHGDGTYAFFGQLQAGSIIVKVGDHVRRGQPIARLGLSGDGASPHLHFHLMDGPSMVGGDGLPFVFKRFAYSGQLDPTRLAQDGLNGDYAGNRFARSVPRTQQLPLDLAVVDFIANSPTAGSPFA